MTRITEQHMDDGGIAVIGMAGHYAGADDLAAFWTAVESGRCLGERLVDYFISPVAWDDATPSYVVHARAMVQAALEDAYVTRPNEDLTLGIWVVQDFRSMRQSVQAGSLAAWLAREFNCRGVALDVDTKCSSVVVALQCAELTLRAGRCDAAVICAVGVGLEYEVFGRSGLLRRDARSTARVLPQAQLGDRAEAAGALVLMRACDAYESGRRLYAQVRSVECGFYGAPTAMLGNVGAMAALIRKAVSRSGLADDGVDHIELQHLGRARDPIAQAREVEAFRQALLEANVVSSVGGLAPVIGYTANALGMPALQKSCLMFIHNRRPPVAAKLSSHVVVDESDRRFHLPKRPESWVPRDVPRSICVSTEGSTRIMGVVVLTDR